MSRIFGDLRQKGYVVPDIEAALDHWTRVLGVGPFYYFDRVSVEEFQYRGGLHHVAYWTETFDADMARLGDTGLEVGQSGRIGADGRFVYFDIERDTERDTEGTREGRAESPGVMPGTVVELCEISGAKGSFFAHLARKAATWDGREAIIRR